MSSAEPSSPAAGVTERLRSQALLFSAAPPRHELLALTPGWPVEPVTVRVHRNHAVESALSVATPYLQYAGLAPEWIVADYDDSLSFGADGGADVEVVWLDLSRFGDRLGPEELAGWLAGRVAALREGSDAPILVLDGDGSSEFNARFNPALADALAAVLDVGIADRAGALAELGERFFDARRERLTGTRMSAAGALASARGFGRWIPALIRPRLKAVVVDADQTLYRGVLGEDGIGGVTLTDGHRDLQQQLLDLKASGLFLALASRNDPDQLRELFDARDDFPLGWADFDATAVSWGAKSAGLGEIAGALRIDPSALLFIDDNPGELVEVALAHPAMGLVHAGEDAGATARAVADHPGIFTFTTTAEDRLRSADLRASAQRDRALAQADTRADPGAYFRELAITLTVSHDRPEQLPRLVDLSAKTNQFNLTLSRLSSAQVEAFIEGSDRQVSSVALSDRLTDSGVIAMLLARRDGDVLIVEELTISCRALGRRLEDLMVAEMLVSGPLFAGVDRVRFTAVEGPRNQPARDWLARFSSATAGRGEAVEVSADTVRAASVNPDVTIKVV